MPETTISFETGSLDARVEMRGVLASLRRHPLVTAVRRVDESPPPGRQSWVIEHAEVSELSGSTEERQLATQLQRLEYYPPLSNPNPEPQPPQGQEFRESLVRRALETPFRSALAQSMIAPLRQRLDYSGIGRRTFLVEELPQGALPVYNREPQPSAVDVGRSLHDAMEALVRLGTVNEPTPPTPQQSILRADRVRMPEFEIVSNPTINLADIRERRFNLIDRGPPTPPPPWVGIGVYIRNKKDAEDLWLITGVDEHNVTMERWRGVYRTATVAFSSLTERYEPCLAPAPPPTRYERDLEV